jgi:AsmA protein
MRGEVRAVGGDISADLDAGDFHGGTAHAELRGRATLTSLELALDAEAGNVSMGPLFQDLLGKEYFRGKGLIELDLRATGTDVAEFVHALEGRTLWHMPDGGQMKLFHDVVRKAPSPAGGTAQETLGRGREGDQGRPRDSTPITKAKATGNISGGVLRNSDLRVDSLVLKLRGDGVVNLADGQVDYSMVLELLGIARIPMRIQGPVLNPGVEVQPIRSLGQTAGNIISDAIRLPFRSLDTLGEILQLDRLKP